MINENQKKNLLKNNVYDFTAQKRLFN